MLNCDVPFHPVIPLVSRFHYLRHAGMEVCCGSGVTRKYLNAYVPVPGTLSPLAQPDL